MRQHKKNKVEPRADGGHARARANIALAKYWGKSDTRLNLPAVPSISLTLDRLVTETEVRFVHGLKQDRVSLDGKAVTGAKATRAIRVLDAVRKEAGLSERATVASSNRFPTAAGLASSASGFAALVAATRHAAGLPHDEKAIGRLARQSSASAARSVYGGFVELAAGKQGNAALCAKPLFGPEHWDVRLVLALTATGPKAVGSTDGMERSRKTSPLYDAWLKSAPTLTRKIKRALRDRDLETLGRAMEQSTMSFHGCAHSSDPPLIYWQPATLSAFAAVQALRGRGVPVYATMDAGPHVKALCEARDSRRVAAALRKVDAVLDVWVCRPGAGLEVW